MYRSIFFRHETRRMPMAVRQFLCLEFVADNLSDALMEYRFHCRPPESQNILGCPAYLLVDRSCIEVFIEEHQGFRQIPFIRISPPHLSRESPEAILRENAPL